MKPVKTSAVSFVLLKKIRKRWRQLIAIFFAILYIAISIIVFNTLRNDIREANEELIDICSSLIPNVEKLPTTEEVTARNLIHYAVMSVSGLNVQNEVNVTAALRAIASKETGCMHKQNNRVIKSSTWDIGWFQIHIHDKKDREVFDRTGTWVKNGIAIHTREGNVLYAAMMFKWKAKTVSSIFRKTGQLPYRDLRKVFQAYNGSGPAAVKYSVDVLKRYHQFKEKYNE